MVLTILCHAFSYNSEITLSAFIRVASCIGAGLFHDPKFEKTGNYMFINDEDPFIDF